MKRIALLIIVLIVASVIFFMVHKQSKMALMTKKMAALPTGIIEEIDDALQDVSQAINQERENLISDRVESIEKNYEQETDEPMPQEVQDEIRQDIEKATKE